MFKSVDDIIRFLISTRFSDASFIEVIRNCYFTEREKRVFRYYPAYLSRVYRQAEIGYHTNLSQPTVSLLFRQCCRKLRIFRALLSKMPYHWNQIKMYCTPKAQIVFSYALAGVRFARIARMLRCTVFNVSLICKHALSRLRIICPSTYYWAISILKTRRTLRGHPLDPRDILSIK